MADTKITALTAITTVDPAVDVFPIVDVSDTTMAASGTTKKITTNQLLGASGTATLASATITGDLTVDTNTLKVDSSNNIVGVGVVPSSGIGNLQIGGSANASLYVQQGTDTVRAGIRATGRTGILLDSSDATYTNRAWYFDNVGSSGSLVIGRQGLDVVTFSNPGNLGLGTAPSSTIWSSDETRLVVKGSSNNFAGTIAVQSKGTGNAVTGYFVANDIINELSFGSKTNSPVALYANNTKYWDLTTSGNLAPINGKGIDFSATADGSGTMTSELLNDYEEGTFTPTVIGTTSAGTGTYTTQVGRYTKVGNLVTVQVNIAWTAHTGTGSMRLGGLPFAASSDASSNSSVSFGYVNDVSLTAGNIMTGFTSVSNSFIDCYQTPSGGGAANPVPIDTSAQVLYSVSYRV